MGNTFSHTYLLVHQMTHPEPSMSPPCDWGADRPPRPPALWASDRLQRPLCRFYENRRCYLRSWGLHLVLIEVAYRLSAAPNCARGIGGQLPPLPPCAMGSNAEGGLRPVSYVVRVFTTFRKVSSLLSTAFEDIDNGRL